MYSQNAEINKKTTLISEFWEKGQSCDISVSESSQMQSGFLATAEISKEKH